MYGKINLQVPKYEIEIHGEIRNLTKFEIYCEILLLGKLKKGNRK